MAAILDGKKIAAETLDEIKSKVQHYLQTGKRPPRLAVVLVGNDYASQIYVASKQKACDKVGIQSKVISLSNEASTESLVSNIRKLNQDPRVDGILVQLPLPKHIDPIHIIETIDPNKDVDGFHPFNVGRLMQRKPHMRPCTPAGIMALLDSTGESLEGKDAVVVGVSNIVGRPMILELLLRGVTVTACHRFSQDLSEKVKLADLLVVATGNAHLIPGEWLKPGCIVIDVGMNRLQDGKLVGDVDFETAKSKASWITPVPGGVGPMTVAYLIKNTLYAYETFHIQ